MESFKKMPERIISQQKRQKADADIRACIRAVQQAIANLSATRDYVLPHDITAITAADVSAQSEKHITAITTDMILTDEEKKAKKKSWQGVRALQLRYVRVIETELQKFPQLQWQYFAAGNTFIPANSIADITAEMATFSVPAEIAEFYDLLCATTQQVQLLQREMKKNGLVMNGLSFMQFYDTPEKLAEAWFNNEELKKWAIRQHESRITMGDGTSVTDVMQRHAATIRQQQQEHERLRLECLNHIGQTQEVQLNATPINY